MAAEKDEPDPKPKECNKPAFASKDIGLIVIMGFVHFNVATLYSCFGLFFPKEAYNKGVTLTVVGLVFGCFELTRFVVSPIHGKLIPIIGLRLMYTVGIIGTSLCLILFGLLEYCPPGALFIALCFGIRIAEAVFAAGLLTAGYAIIAEQMPQTVAFNVGILTTAYMTGHSVGPVIGGGLFEIGGFKMPFFTLGGVLFTAGILSLFFIPPSKSDSGKPKSTEKKSVGYLKLLSNPVIALMLFAIISNSILMGLYETAFVLHLEKFNLRPMLVAAMFTTQPGIFLLMSPIAGLLVDRCPTWVPCMMLTGATSCAIGMLIIGPAPFLSINMTLMSTIISCAMLGFGVSLICQTEAFPVSLRQAKSYGYPDDLSTIGIVSGLCQTANGFGSFLGPVLGGVSVDQLGFAWATALDSLQMAILV